jgi:threonine dehydratase
MLMHIIPSKSLLLDTVANIKTINATKYQKIATYADLFIKTNDNSIIATITASTNNPTII